MKTRLSLSSHLPRAAARLALILGLSALGWSAPGALHGQVVAKKTAAKAPTAVFRRGDADGDGRYSIQDAITVLEYLQGGPEPACLDAADANDDGSITPVDAKLIIDYVLGSGAGLPPPGDLCGADPTQDALGCRSSNCDGAGPAAADSASPDAKAGLELPADFLSLDRDQTGAISFQMRAGVDVPRDDFQRAYGELFGLDPGSDTLRIKSEKASASDASFRSTKLEQIHAGLRVIGAEIVLVERNGRVAFGLGRLIAPIPFGASPVLHAEDAVTLSFAEIARQKELKVVDVQLTAPPETELVIASRGATWEPSSYRLAWRCTLPTSRPAAHFTVDIDAWTGDVLFLTDGIHTLGPSPDWAAAACHGKSVHDDYVDFTGESHADGTHRLQRYGAYGIATFDNRNTTSMVTEIDFQSPTDQFIFATLQAGVGAHWGAEMTLAYFNSKFAFLGADGQGGTLISRVHWDTGFDGARTFGAQRTVVFGDGLTTDPVSYTAVDVIAHEITHVVTHWTAGLVYSGESGALNESFSDIMAVAVQFDTLGPGANWSLGEDLYPDGCCVERWFDMPKGIGKTPPIAPWLPIQPTTFQGSFYEPTGGPCTPVNDNCGVHINSGVQNRWFFRLSEGGSGRIDENPANPQYLVHGIGMEKAARIAFTNLTTKLISSSTFAMSRTGSSAAAQEIYGEFSQEHASVEDAWYAVGVGAAHAGFVHDPPDNQMNVDPWPAVFRWEAGSMGQNVWDVQISTTSTFTNPVFSGTAFGTSDFMGTSVGQVDVDLKPETQYFWRVREHTDSDVKGWRPVKTFTTAARTPLIVSPRSPQFHYPWNVTFEWEPVPGAQAYDVEISTQSDFAKLISPGVTVTGATSVELVARVGKTHYWRVRALLNEDARDIAGRWAKEQFQTPTPGVTLASPPNFALVYPWPAEFDWNPVNGATKYVAEISTVGEGFDDYVVKRVEVDLPVTETELNLQATKTAHWWRVTAIGPMPEKMRWATPDYPWWPEQAQSGIRTYQVDADATTPVGESPDKHSWEKYGSNIKFMWYWVDNATAFQFTFWRITNPVMSVSSSDVDWSSPVTVIVTADSVAHNPGVYYTHEIDMDSLNPGLGTWGYVWYLQSFGPGGLPGYGYWENFFWATGDMPTIISTPAAENVPIGPDLELCWTSQHAPGGKYELRIYENDTYSTTEIFGEFVNGTPGTTVCRSFPTQGLKPFTYYSWSVRAWGPEPWIATPNSRQFITGAAPEEPPESPPTPSVAPQVPPHMWGLIGTLPVMFTAVPNADRYQIEVYLNQTPENGGSLVDEFTFTTAEIINHMNDLFNDLGVTEPAGLTSHVLIALLSGTTSGFTYYYRVRGCAGSSCGPVSTWSKFTEADNVTKLFLAWNEWLQQQGAPQF